MKWSCTGCSSTLCFVERRPWVRFVALSPLVLLSTGIIEGPLWATLPVAVLAVLGIDRFSRTEVATMPGVPASSEGDIPAAKDRLPSNEP